jgi:glycine/D-amino acid oxidase-like deaminating enzyme
MQEARHAVAWHEDAPNPSDHATPPSEPLPTSVDWVVIGGGFSGLSAARRAAERGARVLLLEKGELRDGASSRNGGMAHVGFGASTSSIIKRFGTNGAREWFDLSRAAVRRVEALAGRGDGALLASTGIDAQWSGTGHLELTHAARGLPGLHAEAELRASLGLPVRLLDRGAVQQLTNSGAFAGGLAVDEGGGVQPARLHAAMAAAARAAGVEIREETPAAGIIQIAGGYEVRTPRGSIRTQHIFGGVNGYAGHLFPALRRRAIPVGSFMIATEPLAPELLATVAGRGEMRFDTRNFLSYWRPTPDGRIAFGGRTSFWPDSLPRIARTLTARMREIHPQLASTAVTHAWGGRLSFAFDRLPRVTRLDGVTHVSGCAGSGVALMTLLAEQTIDWELGGDPPLPARIAWHPVPVPYEGLPWFLPFAGIGFALEDWWSERR